MSQAIEARIIRDTGSEPRRAGVRSRDVTSRGQLYEAESYMLYLRRERETGGPLTTLVGEVIDGQSASPIGELGVVLRIPGGEVPVPSHPTGEFLVSYEPHPEMTLRIQLGGGRHIEVPLDRRLTDRLGPDEDLIH